MTGAPSSPRNNDWKSPWGDVRAALERSHSAERGATSVLNVRRSIFVNDADQLEEDTKTHQHRRIVMDAEPDAVLDEHEARCRQRADELGIPFDPNGYIFSPAPDGSRPLHPDSVSKRYARMAKRLGIAPSSRTTATTTQPS